jgi:hypothetical protein
MSIFDFITQDEIDDLPEDPSLAFMSFVQHAQRRLAVLTDRLDASDETGWHKLQDVRYGFQNVIVAAAKRFRIEPFLNSVVPQRQHFNRSDEDYRQFVADLDHYMTQLVLDSSMRSRRDSVFIAPPVKDKIRKYLHGLKTAVDQSNFPASKRAALLEKLAEFERDLEKQRLSLIAVTRFMLGVMVIPGGAWASWEVVSKLTTSILQVVAEAKSVDDENRSLPPSEAPAVLLPPRRSEPRPTNELDDDVPF